MGHRFRFMLLIWFSACVFTVVIWRTGRFVGGGDFLFGGSSELGEYFGGRRTGGRWIHNSIFYMVKNGKEKKDREHEEEDGGAGEVEDENGAEPGNEDNERGGAENKTVVLMWTKYYAVRDEALMAAILSGRKWDPNCCSGDDLIVTLDRSLLPRATVVVFFNYFGNLDKKDLPTRYPGQLWVLFGKESPTHSMALGQFPNLFNWTMSYRQDSDIYCPYGFTETLATPIPPTEPILMPGDIPLPQWISNKRSILAGVISHCPTRSRRERLVQALRNASLPVDIFGSCGNRTICPRTIKTCDHDKFWRNLAAQYMFYFAAENSICVDYITEKFWRTLEQGMVPLAYGGGNYSLVAPPNSFIDVSQFKSPQEIADHLKKVANDPEEYAKYFEWKRTHKIQLTDGWGGWCTLCRLARQYKTDPENVEISPNKSYANLREWWLMAKKGNKSKACSKPPFPL